MFNIAWNMVFACLLLNTVYARPRECKDVYIWAFDGSVECEYLKKPTFFGVHEDPDYWCNTYPLTQCCATCTELRNDHIIP